jgi:hypothetical protein
MRKKRHTPEQIIKKIRAIEVMVGQRQDGSRGEQGGEHQRAELLSVEEAICRHE